MLSQCVQQPTRGNNILDIVCSNNPYMINRVDVYNNTLSDHKIVQLSVSIHVQGSHKQNQTVSKEGFAALDFSRADYSAISVDIINQDWCNMKQNCA